MMCVCVCMRYGVKRSRILYTRCTCAGRLHSSERTQSSQSHIGGFVMASHHVVQREFRLSSERAHVGGRWIRGWGRVVHVCVRVCVCVWCACAMTRRDPAVQVAFKRIVYYCRTRIRVVRVSEHMYVNSLTPICLTGLPIYVHPYILVTFWCQQLDMYIFIQKGTIISSLEMEYSCIAA